MKCASWNVALVAGFDLGLATVFIPLWRARWCRDRLCVLPVSFLFFAFVIFFRFRLPPPPPPPPPLSPLPSFFFFFFFFFPPPPPPLPQRLLTRLRLSLIAVTFFSFGFLRRVISSFFSSSSSSVEKVIHSLELTQVPLYGLQYTDHKEHQTFLKPDKKVCYSAKGGAGGGGGGIKNACCAKKVRE